MTDVKVTMNNGEKIYFKVDDHNDCITKLIQHGFFTKHQNLVRMIPQMEQNVLNHIDVSSQSNKRQMLTRSMVKHKYFEKSSLTMKVLLAAQIVKKVVFITVEICNMTGDLPSLRWDTDDGSFTVMTAKSMLSKVHGYPIYTINLMFHKNETETETETEETETEPSPLIDYCEFTKSCKCLLIIDKEKIFNKFNYIYCESRLLLTQDEHYKLYTDILDWQKTIRDRHGGIFPMTGIHALELFQILGNRLGKVHFIKLLRDAHSIKEQYLKRKHDEEKEECSKKREK